MDQKERRATITTLEWSAVVKVLGMQSGYPLDFTNNTFSFFMAEHDVEIYSPAYDGSKANRLHQFLVSAEASHAAAVLEGLLNYRAERADAFDDLDVTKELERVRSTIQRLQGQSVVLSVTEAAADHLSVEYLEQIETKIGTRLNLKDWEGAVTLSRTLIEEILGAIEEKLVGERMDYEGSLARQFKAVAKKLHIDEQQIVDEKFKQIVRGLGQIIEGIAPITNKVGDRHARTSVPAPHHARLTTNAAKTVASFLIDSYKFQFEKGLVTPSPAKGAVRSAAK